MRYVLFVCNHNAGRSQMAQAFFERHAPADIRAESAGSDPGPQVWPEVVQAMAEVGIELSDRRPKKLLREMQLHADWAVTMGCGDACPYVPTIVESWDIPDPAGRPLDEVREIRNAIEARVSELIEENLDAIRSDRTAHQLRLASLLPQLATSSTASAPMARSARARTRSSRAMTSRRSARTSSRSRIAKPATASARSGATR